jgi:GH25 family lysozyme M1 (1,4-beta-N-acetylmuramidase)
MPGLHFNPIVGLNKLTIQRICFYAGKDLDINLWGSKVEWENEKIRGSGVRNIIIEIKNLKGAQFENYLTL